MTKAEQALAIYKEEATKTDDQSIVRNECVQRFINELDMTQSGATTYYHNSKKKAAGVDVKSYYKNNTSDPSSDKPDARVMYTIVHIEDGLVESTESGYDLKMLKARAGTNTIVKGLPDIGKPLTFKPV